MDYRKMETFWLVANASEVAKSIAKGNTEAEKALGLILSRIDGARVFKDLQTDLTAEEWAKVYRLCGDDVDMLISSVIVMGCLNDLNHIHENLRLEYPAPFVVSPILDITFCRNDYVARRKLRDEFLHRLKTAKRSQPK